MAATTRVTLKIRVYNGPAAVFVFHVDSSVVSPDSLVITGLITVLQAVTRGKVISIEISLRAAVAGSPTSGVPYISEDKALMRFVDEQGQGHAWKVAGLKAGIIAADKETVVSGNSDVIVYKNAITGNALTRAGDAISSFISGHRTENRKPIKAGRVV